MNSFARGSFVQRLLTSSSLNLTLQLTTFLAGAELRAVAVFEDGNDLAYEMIDLGFR